MSQSGWFPDPAGQPGKLRWWDGGQWTDQLTDAPNYPGSGGGKAAPSGAPGPGQTGGPPRNRALQWGLIGLVLLILVALAVFFLPNLFRSPGGPTGPVDTSSPTASSWDETSHPTPPPTPTPTPTPTPRRTSAMAPTPCPTDDVPVRDGRLYGGRLSVPIIDDPRWSAQPVRSIPWAVCANGLERVITDDWISEVILAGVQPGSLTPDLESQALAIADDGEDRFYARGTTSIRTLDSKATTIDGLPAWELRLEVRVSEYGPAIPGDVFIIVVVQHPDDVRSALLTFATIGDTQTIRAVDAARAAVRVER